MDDVDADVVLVEPARPRALAFARSLHDIRASAGHRRRLDPLPRRSRPRARAVAHLDKPFERRDLERALDTALAA